MVLVTVGAGEEVDGAGAGGLLGGASVGEGRADVGAAVGCGVGWADGADDAGEEDDGADCAWPAPVAAALVPGEPAALRGFSPCRVPVCAWLWAGVSAAGAGLGGAALWLPVVAAGAVRANTIANPTVVSAPIWVLRQVSRPSRRKPASRACAGESS